MASTQLSHPAGPSTSEPRHAFWRLLSLKSDRANPELIDTAVRDNARVAGTNLWVLIFAIVIASVGLNVNSTAVVIGAMLISPLMGPIIGIGYGAGVHDQRLIRASLANLATFAGISLLASTAYFAISPLTHAQSEILARTSPTIWDVLVAFFGGAAGMIGLTRKEKTTLIPGVAIATALMPPLCTAGYGLATGQARIFIGAFYLFLINGVFIALASLVVVRLLRLPRRSAADAQSTRRTRVVIFLVVAAMLVPSVVLASRLVRQEIFASNAERFVREVEQIGSDVVLLSREVDTVQRSITLTLMGKGVNDALQQTLEQRLSELGMAEATLRVRHPSEDSLQVDSLKRDLQRELLHSTLTTVEAQSARIDRLERSQAAIQARTTELANLEVEIRALLPELRRVVVSGTTETGTSAGLSRMLVAIDTTRHESCPRPNFNA